MNSFIILALVLMVPAAQGELGLGKFIVIRGVRDQVIYVVGDCCYIFQFFQNESTIN